MQGSILLPPPPFILPLPVGSSINLMLLTLLDVFPQLSQSAGAMPVPQLAAVWRRSLPAVAAVQSQP